MKDANMKTHYVYKTTNRTTGEYYYGKRSCDGHWREDSYMGSGTLLNSKMSAHPDHDWHKEVLLLLDSEEEAYEYEAVVIGDKWREGAEGGDDLCLNLCAGGFGRDAEGARMMWQDPEFRARMSAKHTARYNDPAARAATSAAVSAACTPVRREQMSDIAKSLWQDPAYRELNVQKCVEAQNRPELRQLKSLKHRQSTVKVALGDKVVDADKRHLVAYLRLGAEFITKCVSVHNDKLRVHIYTHKTSARKLILKYGFKHGRRRLYDTTTLKELAAKGYTL